MPKGGEEMINIELTAPGVIEILIALRDRLIKENSKKFENLRERMLEPDALEFAINFLEKNT